MFKLNLPLHDIKIKNINSEIYVFDIIRKNKNIGSLITTFKKEDDKLQIRTILDIKVKVFLITVYKFFQDTTETWIEGEFVKIEGYTNFEDEREYYIEGNDLDENFIASGMDGELTLSNKILPLNYWNKKILEEEEVFDTQKGIVRKITVQKLKNDIIKMDNKKIEAEKYILNASKNPKDKGPFPQYTLWYKDDELIKFEDNTLIDSPIRLQRMHNLIKNIYGNINLDNIKNILGDHCNFPSSICRHGANNMDTVSGYIADPSNKTFHIRKGFGCEMNWQSYIFN